MKVPDGGLELFLKWFLCSKDHSSSIGAEGSLFIWGPSHFCLFQGLPKLQHLIQCTFDRIQNLLACYLKSKASVQGRTALKNSRCPFTQGSNLLFFFGPASKISVIVFININVIGQINHAGEDAWLFWKHWIILSNYFTTSDGVVQLVITYTPKIRGKELQIFPWPQTNHHQWACSTLAQPGMVTEQDTESPWLFSYKEYLHLSKEQRTFWECLLFGCQLIAGQRDFFKSLSNKRDISIPPTGFWEDAEI